MTRNSVIRLLSLLTATSLAGHVFAADEPPDSTSGSVTIGVQGGGGIDESSKLQQFETVPKGVFLPAASLVWKGASNYFLDFKGSKLGLDDQFAALAFGKTDTFKLHLSWDQNPNWMSNTARTPYTEVAPGVFHVPDGMRLALQNVFVPWIPGTAANPIGTGTAPANPTVKGFDAVAAWVDESQPIDLRYLRRTGKAGLSFDAGENWAFKLGYAKEMRDGNKNTTFYGGPAYEVATPIAFTTHDFRGDADFAKDKVFASASASYSRFLNDVPYAVIDNPERLELTSPLTGRAVINDAATFRLWMPPDNQAVNLDLSAGVRLPKSHKVTVSFSTGRMTMETDLLPIATNPGLATSATAPNTAFTITPPYADVKARFDNLMGNVRFTGDPSKWFGYILSFRKFEMKDKTEEYRFQSAVRGDVGPSYTVAGYARAPEGFESQSLRGEVHARPAKGLRLGLSFGRDERTYDRREYADISDDVITAAVDYTLGRVGFHGVWSSLDRVPGEENEEAIPASWQGASQTDIVERKRHTLSGLVSVMATDTLSISLTGQKQSNEFPESVTGLLDQSFSSVGADVTYAPTAKLTCYAGYVFEKYFFDMAAAYIPRGLNPPFNPANLWGNQTTDQVDTVRVGFNWVLQPEKWTLDAGVDYTKPRSDSLYDFALPGTPLDGGLNEANGIFPATVPAIPGFPATSFDRFPQVSKNFLIAKVRLEYKLAERITASALYWKQKFDNVDWATENTLPYMGGVDPGANRWFFLGARVPSYNADILRASITYTF